MAPMRLLDAEEALAIARRVVAASRADETEVTLDSTVEGYVRFAEVGPTQVADRGRVELAIRVRRREPGGGFREARATTGTTAEADWRMALERALRLAEVSPVDEEAPALDGAVEVRATTADAATLAHGFEEKAAWVRAAVAACERAGLRPAGLVRTGGLARAIASSAGRGVHGALARAAFSMTASGEGGSGIGQALAGAVDGIDPEAVVRRAVAKASAAQRPEPLDPGEYTVVLEPLAVSAILLFASYQGFGARELDEESSFLCGRLGQKLFPDALSIHDDAGDERYPGLSFDGEGTPRQRVALVERGRLGGPVTDRRYARKLGLPCTGHAAPQPSSEGPAARNLVVAAGDRSLEELVASVDRGLLVTQFHYTNMIEPRELTLTGMTRNGTFLIEKGEVRAPVQNLRFTETLVRALARVRGVAKETEVAGALFDGEVVTPALSIEGFRFTSTTDF